LPCPKLRTCSFSWFGTTSACCCTILLYNHIPIEGWKPCANRGPMCTLENFQCCEEPYFAGAAILRGRCLLLFPRWGNRKSLLIWSVPYGGLV
jgi:hypothetical protein